MNKIIIAHKEDNVGTATTKLESNTLVQGFKTIQNIPAFHKVAIQKILKGDAVVKYGEMIGKATEDILPGMHVHIHNVESTRGRGDKRELKL